MTSPTAPGTPTAPPSGIAPGAVNGRSRVAASAFGSAGMSSGTSETPLSGAGPLTSMGRKMTASAINTTAPTKRCFREESIDGGTGGRGREL